MSNEIFALRGPCPHQNWQHFEYDVRTGENHFPANVYPEDMLSLRSQLRPVKTYPVEVKGTKIWVDLE